MLKANPEHVRSYVLDAVNEGEELPAVTFPPITRLQLALYCGGSGDHNPIHVDLDFARNAGMKDVFAHGMLPMGLMSRRVAEIAYPGAVKTFGTRFVAITEVGDQLTVKARVAAVDKSSKSTTLELTCTNQKGVITLKGHALVVTA